jgi:heat-inducible transcriptional repressor
MADLEALGFLEKPHTSAGRVPTDKGYRLYVDSLLKVRSPSVADRERIEQMAKTAEVDKLVEDTAGLLHSLSHHAGVVTLPHPTTDPLKHIEFVALRDNRCLAVFVSQAGLVTNKVLQLEFKMAPAQLVAAGNYLTEKLRDATLADLRARILAEMRADKGAIDDLIEKTLALAEQTFIAAGPSAMVVDGEASFLDTPEFADIQKARTLLRAFAEKDRILRVLDKALSARDVQIFIGSESDLAALPDVSVVAAPYGRGESILGTLAVIGPTRMDYARVIPLVDLTARELSRALGNDD